ncbi:hypothetical protein E2I00_003154, partial [Balaenoptera physalus]
TLGRVPRRSAELGCTGAGSPSSLAAARTRSVRGFPGTPPGRALDRLCTPSLPVRATRDEWWSGGQEGGEAARGTRFGHSGQLWASELQRVGRPGKAAEAGKKVLAPGTNRINQSSRWGLSLGLGFCVTGHMPGPTRWEMRRPGEKASGPTRNLGWVPSPRGGALACTERAPRKALCHRTCLGRSWRGWGGLRETPGQSRESDRGAGRGGGEGGEPQEPRPRGQQMRGRCEVPRRGGKTAFSVLTLPSSTVKTRTKDKYRVVYTDHQRLELEKEFHYSRYITIRRKAELAATLGLSERQGSVPGPVPGVLGPTGGATFPRM